MSELTDTAEPSPQPPDVYERFKEEVDAMVVAAKDPAVKVVGDLTRAVKRAQMVHDGELDPAAQRIVAALDGATNG